MILMYQDNDINVTGHQCNKTTCHQCNKSGINVQKTHDLNVQRLKLNVMRPRYLCKDYDLQDR